MTIVNKNVTKTKFKELDYGSVFKDECSNYCMKIECLNGANMVYLSDGMTDYMDNEEEFERVRCQLVVEN